MLVSQAYDSFLKEDNKVTRRNLRKAINTALVQGQLINTNIITAIFESNISVQKTNIDGIYEIGCIDGMKSHTKPTLKEMANTVMAMLAERNFDDKLDKIECVITDYAEYGSNSEFAKELDESVILKKQSFEVRNELYYRALIAKHPLAFELKLN